MTNKTYATNTTYKTYLALTIIIAAILTAPFARPLPVRAATLTKAPSNLGLVGYWPLDDASGVIASDSSGNGNTGTITGASWASGKRGKALDFNGTDQHVSVTASSVLNPTTALTVSAWIKPDAVDNEWGPVVESGGNLNSGTGYFFGYYTASNSFIFEVGDGSYDSVSVLLPVGQWYHVVGTYSASGNLYLYVNGVQVGTHSHTVASISYDSNPFTIGKLAYCCATGHHFDGQIDDVRVYNRALSAADVATLYRSGQVTRKSVSERGLVGYWPFNENRGTVAGDSSGKANTATFAGGALPTWINGKRSNGLNFAGGDTYLTHNTTGISSTNGTVAGWVYPTAAQWGFWQTHDSASQNWVDWISMFNYWGGTFYFRMGNGSDCCSNDLTFTTSSYIPQNQWSYIAFTWSGTSDAVANDTMAVYVNGALVTSRSNANFQATVDSSARIGYGHGIPFTGKYDDLRFYNRALSAAEIQNLYRQNETTLNANTNNRLTDGLVGLWSFNGNNLNMASTTAEILDMSGQGNNGDNSGGRADAGRIGQGWSFDGVDDTINVGQKASFNGLSAMTFSAWIKVSAFTSSYRAGIVSRRPGLNFVVTGINGSPEANYQRLALFDSGGPAIYANTILNTDEWYHAAVSINGTSATFYLNGTADGSGTLSYSWTSNVDITLGSIAGIAGYYFNGILDEVRIYNRALSAAEIKQLYNLGK